MRIISRYFEALPFTEKYAYLMRACPGMALSDAQISTFHGHRRGLQTVSTTAGCLMGVVSLDIWLLSPRSERPYLPRNTMGDHDCHFALAEEITYHAKGDF